MRFATVAPRLAVFLGLWNGFAPAACGSPSDEPAGRQRSTRESTSALAAGRLDSIQDSADAVRAALEGFFTQYPGLTRRRMVVTRFVEDRTGFVVEFAPVQPRDSAIAGGGGLMRVEKSGRVVVLRLHQ